MPVILDDIGKATPSEFRLRAGGPSADLTLSGTVSVKRGPNDPKNVEVHLTLTVKAKNGCIVFDEDGVGQQTVERFGKLPEGEHELEGEFALKMPTGSNLADSAIFSIEIVVNDDDTQSDAWKLKNRA